MSRRMRAWGAVALVVAVLGVAPVVLERDSFPMSTFPMFARPRSPQEAVTTVVARAGHGRILRLSPERIGGTDEVIQATVTVVRAVRAGTADALCREVAGRVATDGPADAVAVEVVTESYDAVAWYDGDRTPRSRRVHAACAVASAAPPS